jgi:hypothetical protein
MSGGRLCLHQVSILDFTDSSAAFLEEMVTSRTSQKYILLCMCCQIDAAYPRPLDSEDELKLT